MPLALQDIMDLYLTSPPPIIPPLPKAVVPVIRIPVNRAAIRVLMLFSLVQVVLGLDSFSTIISRS
jgi:hypothetical protein